MRLTPARRNYRFHHLLKQKKVKKPAIDWTQRWIAIGAVGLAMATAATAAVSIFAVIRSDAANREQQKLIVQGQITDRFTKANDQLTSDKVEGRLGGIYALEQIMKDASDYENPIIEILSVYVRNHAPLTPPSPQSTEKQAHAPHPSIDVLAALTVLGRRPDPEWHSALDLSSTDLRGADLTRANLTSANLTFANLTDANLPGANLTRANLTRTNLTGADLTRANLTSANLTRANLTFASLTRANLTSVNLTHADLAFANLTGAYLASADLTGANLPGADLPGADLTRANLTSANLTFANLTDANLPGANLTRANLTSTNLTGADLTDANLTDAKGRTK